METEESRWGRRVFWAAMLGLLLLGGWLRFADLGLKPLHSDEGVNGWFTLRLYWWNVYRYQAQDYHGPFLYYVNLLAFWLCGPSDVALRSGTALFGTALPLLLVPARRWLGRTGVIVAGLLLATAPCMVYFSRTVIHEMYLVFFTTLWVVALASFARGPSVRAAVLAAVGALGCFTNKETALITAGCLGVGAGLSWLLGRRVPDEGGAVDPDLFGGRGRLAALMAWFEPPARIGHFLFSLVRRSSSDRPRLEFRRLWVGSAPGAGAWYAGLACFALGILLFFTSFFSFWPGFGRFFEAFALWFEHSEGRNQSKPWTYFWEVMARTEGPTTWVALVACAWAVVRRHRFGLALAGWAVSAFAVYSYIPYKTPWCVLNVDLPVFLLCGWLAGQCMLAAGDFGLPPLVRALSLLAVLGVASTSLVLLPRSMEDNVERYDDKQVPYVYVQTQRGFLEMMQDMVGVGASDPDGDGLGPRTVNVGAKNPTRWYTITRGWDHSRSRYLKEVPKKKHVRKADIVVVTGRDRRATRRLVLELGEWHREEYQLRPGHRVVAWYREDLWEAYEDAGGRDAFQWPVSESDSIHRPPKPKRYWTSREKRAASSGSD